MGNWWVSEKQILYGMAGIMKGHVIKRQEWVRGNWDNKRHFIMKICKTTYNIERKQK